MTLRVTLLTLRSLHVSFSENLHSSETMPKNKKATDSKGKSIEVSLNMPSNQAVYLNSKGEVVVKIHAKPGAKKSAITDVGADVVGVQIGAPPVDGEANKELIRYLGEVLKLKKSELTLDKGSRSKEKTVIIMKPSLSLENVLEALKCAIN